MSSENALNARRAILLVCLAALVPVLVLHLGYTGSDFEFHVGSWREYLTVWRSGVVLPAWTPQANFGLGEPRFLFYPPLSFMLGAALTAILPHGLVVPAYMWVCLVIGGLGALKLSTLFVSGRDRALAGVLFVSSYYLVLDVLLRFVAAEVLAAAIAPLALYFFLRNSEKPTTRHWVGLVVTLALIWETNLPTAIVFGYGLTGAAVIHAAVRRAFRAQALTLAAEAVAVLLAAWYLLPAFVETRLISPATMLVPIAQSSLFFRGGNWFLLNWPLWLWTYAVALAGIYALVRAGRARPAGQSSVETAAIGVLVTALFFQTVVSAPLWTRLPELGFVQFPMRFDVLLVGLGPAVLLLAVRGRAARMALGAVWIGFLALPMLTRVQQQRKHHETVTEAEVEQHVAAGYPGISEYRPKLLVPPASAEGASQLLAAGPGCLADEVRVLPQERSFRSVATNQCDYSLRLAYFPLWTATLDGEAAGMLRPGADGQMVVQVPEGTHRVEVRLSRRAPLFLLAEGLSALVALGLMGLWVASKRSREVV